MTEPRVRRAAIPDDAVLVVRGEELDPDVSYKQAEAFLRRFSAWRKWGVSAYYARNVGEVDDVAGDQLERFPEIAVLRIADLVSAGFEVVPTFRTPHVTIAFGGDLAAELKRMSELAVDRRANPYYDPEQGR